jgi:hypothetical protein
LQSKCANFNQIGKSVKPEVPKISAAWGCLLTKVFKKVIHIFSTLRAARKTMQLIVLKRLVKKQIGIIQRLFNCLSTSGGNPRYALF